MKTIEELAAQVGLPEEHREIVCIFLLVFSRFESALKQAGYARQQGELLVVEWRRFARDTEARCRAGEPMPVGAFRSLIDRPPARQRAIDDRLEWQPEPAPAIPPNLEWLLEMVYRVRNNLFHGGKCPLQPERDLELMKASLMALSHFLDLRLDVAQAYMAAPAGA